MTQDDFCFPISEIILLWVLIPQSWEGPHISIMGSPRGNFEFEWHRKFEAISNLLWNMIGWLCRWVLCIKKRGKNLMPQSLWSNIRAVQKFNSNLTPHTYLFKRSYVNCYTWTFFGHTLVPPLLHRGPLRTLNKNNYVKGTGTWH